PADEKSQSDQNPERMPPQQPSISTPKAQEPNPGTPNNRSSIPHVEVPPRTGQAVSEKTDRTILITSADAVRSAIQALVFSEKPR
ncbi:hypothetical protein, partial [Gluconobacter oxydans]|uniref:hypothetical protein n=1 Tax=Gluconobacter oxydans TaxID=442 RepID=UPI001CD863F3